MTIKKTMILFDDRLMSYHNFFIKTKVVHKEFLDMYIKEILKEVSHDEIIHVFIYDAIIKDTNVSYMSYAIDALNDHRVVLHIIDPKKFYDIPSCAYTYLYIGMDSNAQNKADKVTSLIRQSNHPNSFYVSLIDSYETFTYNIERNKEKTKDA